MRGRKMKHRSEHEARAWEMAMKTVRYYYDGWDLFKASIFGFVFGLIIGFLFGMSVAYASELRHSYKSPAFNGQGFSSHVLTIENLTFQRQKDIDAKIESDRREAEREAKNTNVNKFLANLESRIYAELSKQISEKLFGEDPQTSGTLDLLGNNIQYEMTDENVKLVVNQADGSTTIVDIPIASFAF
jgi:hypothetical protein